MHSNQFHRTRVAAAIAGVVLALGAGQAFGAAFALQTQSGSGLGNAYAGGAASAEDASTVFSNPAGMARFSTIQIVGAANIVTPSIKFHDDGSVNAFNQPLGGTGGDAGGTAAHPGDVRRRPHQPAVRGRARRQRAVRPRNRLGQRLARPLPGPQLEGRDAERRCSAVVEDRPQLHRRRRRGLAEGQGHADQQRQLFRAVWRRARNRRRPAD